MNDNNHIISSGDDKFGENIKQCTQFIYDDDESPLTKRHNNMDKVNQLISRLTQ